jgi:hypothetical protein
MVTRSQKLLVLLHRFNSLLETNVLKIHKELIQKSHDTVSLKVCDICYTCTPLGLFCRAFRSRATRVNQSSRKYKNIIFHGTVI